MKKLLKKTLSVLLAITIIFSSAYVGLSEVEFGDINFNSVNQLVKNLTPDFFVKSKAASSGTCGDNLTWTLDDNGTLTISGTGDMEDYYASSYTPWYSYITNIKSIVIEDGVTSVGDSAFEDSMNITDVSIGNSVTVIGDSAFNACVRLESVLLGNSVTTLEYSSFNGCGSLVSIEIPDSVISIENWVFAHCCNLISIEIPVSVTSIGHEVFGGCKKLTSINVDANNCMYSSVDGVLFNKDKTILVRYPQGKTDTKYTVPLGVESIKGYSFADCVNLTAITISESVSSIGDSAFDECENLVSISIGSGMKSIGSDAFYDCTNLVSVYVTDIFTWANIDFEDYYDSPMVYAEELYINGVLATDISVPNSMESIPSHMLYSCDSVESVIIPYSVTDIGYIAFVGCANLESITVDKNNPKYSSVDGVLFNKDKTTLIKYPQAKSDIEYTIFDGVISLGDGAFENCLVLASITIPNSVTSIGTNSFYGCEELISIKIPDNIKNLGYAAFHKTGYYNDENNWKDGLLYLDNCLIGGDSEIISGDVVIKNGTRIIDSYVFLSCANLTSVTIPEGVVSIGDYAFYGCTGLTSVTLPSTVEHLGDYSFMCCEGLETVTILGGADIGRKAFHYCENLKTFTMGAGKSSIGDAAFVECPKLTTVIIGEGSTSIGRDAFNGCSNLVNLTIPDSVEFIGEYAFYCGYMEDEKNWENGVLYIGKHLLMANPEEVSGIYEIKSGTKTIGSRAFMGCEMLTGVVIPDSVKSICSYAFYETMLISVVIPDGVKTLGEGAFYYCPYLNSVTIPDSVTSLGVFVFAACPSLSSISIPDSITVIPENAFVGSGIQEVALTQSIVSIRDGAFDECENLIAVFYSGSQSDWLKMKIGTDNEYLLEAGLHYNATGHTMVDGTCSVCGYALWEYELYDDHAIITEYLGVETDVVVPDTIEGLPVTEIASGAFTERTSVVSVTVGNNVTKICDQAFLYCLALKSVTLPESLTEIGSVAFSYCLALEEILIPENVSVIGLGALAYCPKLKNIQVDSENKNFASEDGILFNKEKTVLVSYPIGKESKTYNIPENVKVIGDAAFTMCKLENIIIPETVESINSYVFMESTALKSIVITGKETTIGEESIDSSTTVYCYENSVAHEYVVANSLDYVLINLHSIDCDVVVDYENELIFSYADLCSDYTEIISSSTDYDIHVRESFSVDDYKYYGTGTNVAILDDEEIIEEFTIITIGDTDGDSVCDVLDCFDVERASNGNAELTGAYAMAADSNTDDVIDINDYQSIVNKALAQ